ncbi:hypothetical protein [Halomonas mongoliensis]|jgi:hypothetical protein|uniref:hypothetical protein n=1 Tax=Halomonas mongoliensis TaxID=321265 RepID=UPI00403B0788
MAQLTSSALSPRYRVLLAGVFSQLLCIGIARFAYTPLLAPGGSHGPAAGR